MRIAGIGCRKGAPAADVVAAIDAALERCALQRADLGGLAVISQKAREPGILAAAGILGLELVSTDTTDTERATLSRSEHSLAATGTASASEVAALAVAGAGARLLAPRVVAGSATCAIAIGDTRP